MKIKIAVEARVSADRKLCLMTCPWMVWPDWFETDYVCQACGFVLKLDPLGRPLRCRACLRAEVKP